MTIAELHKKINASKRVSMTLIDLDAKKKKEILLKLADKLILNGSKIINANKIDIQLAIRKGKQESFIERLTINEKILGQIAKSLKKIARSPDCVGRSYDEVVQPTGITIKKICVPLGLIAVIYESRPNVTIDAFALAFKSGNAILLKGGKEIKNTNKVFVKIIKKLLVKSKIDPDIIQDFSLLSRVLSSKLLSNNNIDCLIPRGGKKLITFIKNNAKIPIIITGASVVHIYIDEDADVDMARKIIINSKTRRVSTCNALDVLLIHKGIYKKIFAGVIYDLKNKNVSIRADKLSYRILKKSSLSVLKLATLKDFDTEFLSNTLAIKIVNNFKSALEHIQRHSLGHSEGIVTKSKKKAVTFFKVIDAACLYWNTSTQFSDGGEYGLGGEIGISTQKLHARGPFAYQALTTYKYLVSSKGAIRKK